MFSGRQLFVSQISVKNKPWERLNLGFFDSYKEASSLLTQVRKLYPGAWISQASADEATRFIGTAAAPAVTVKPVTSKPAVKAKAVTSKPAGTDGQLTDEQLDSLMTRAKSDFKLEKYPQAIRLFTAIVQAKPNRHSQEALELLGLSRQRNGQNSHAFDVYTQYLKIYTDGDDPKRVSQRLSGLITETKPPRKSIRMSSEEDTGEFIAYGSWSQFYRKDVANTNDIGSVTVNSRLTSFIDLTAIQQTARITHKGQFTADDNYDFLADSDGNEFRFIELYYDMAYRESGSSVRLGRQPLRLGGILKRFDGLSGGYHFTPDIRLNLLAGYPVDIDNKSTINTDKKFIGFTFETGTFLEHWSMNFFHFHQYIFDIDDFTRTGFEVRYSDSTKSLLGLVDYDYIYKIINNFQLISSLYLPGGQTLYLNAFTRKSPELSTENALIGRTETSIEELQQTLNIEQIRQLVLDRTANSLNVTVGGSQPLNDKFQVAADITLSRVDSTVASGGVEATPVVGPDYFYSLQLVGNNLFIKNDTGVLGLRYQDTDPSNTLSLIANSRFPITRNWRINPRLQYDVRKLSDGRSRNKWRALLRTDYRYGRSVRLDFEVGYDDTSEEMNGESLARSDLFYTLGYRWDF